jgi:hypothetical protein
MPSSIRGRPPTSCNVTLLGTSANQIELLFKFWAQSYNMSATDTVLDLLRNPKHTRWIAPALLIAEVLFCGVIILKVPCERILRLDEYQSDRFSRH